MTPQAASKAFRIPARPIDPEVAASREVLLADARFMAEIQDSEHPTAVLSTCHRLVLANDELCRWLEVACDDELVGAVPGDLTPCPGCPDLLARTRFVEAHGHGFFILTIHPVPQPA
jgi:PAS domain-containing protein